MLRMYTEEGRTLPAVAWTQYPRPQMRRKEWLCLNGEWTFLSGNVPAAHIRVPFCPESLLSGIERAPLPGEKMIYQRIFSVPESWSGNRILLHCGAVSRSCTISVNSQPVFRHENGYLPFSIDITDVLRSGENELSIAAVNDLSPCYPLGKQSVRRGGMWYTPCSGIWQTVWLEPVPQEHIRCLHILTGSDWVEITAEGVTSGTVLLDTRQIPLIDGTARISIPAPRQWSPEDPYLYAFSLSSGADQVDSYFALRTLTTETVNGIPRLCLNGKPYFFNGLLDQGYWSDGLYTPAGPEAFEKDILAMKSLGFNTLRKHIKIEPELFYYACDRLGMVVFQDMVNNGRYNYLRDTVLPTVGFLKRNDRSLNPDPESRHVFLSAMSETVAHLSNHPCICLWTIFNEGWGQFCADEAYQKLKAQDPTRFVDSTSGWFHQQKSDVDSFHLYFRHLRLGRERRPQLLSEFGGYVWKVPGHSFNPDRTYGYRKYADREGLVRGLRHLYGRELLPLVSKGLCGAIYTQISDVEDETNGLFTFDRSVIKLHPEDLTDITSSLSRAL